MRVDVFYSKSVGFLFVAISLLVLGAGSFTKYVRSEAAEAALYEPIDDCELATPDTISCGDRTFSLNKTLATKPKVSCSALKSDPSVGRCNIPSLSVGFGE